MTAYRFKVMLAPDDRTLYAHGYPVVVAHGATENEARAEAAQYLDPGESVGELTHQPREQACP